jgi:hypothetical protein
MWLKYTYETSYMTHGIIYSRADHLEDNSGFSIGIAYESSQLVRYLRQNSWLICRSSLAMDRSALLFFQKARLYRHPPRLWWVMANRGPISIFLRNFYRSINNHQRRYKQLEKWKTPIWYMKLPQMCTLVINLQIVNFRSPSCPTRAFWSLSRQQTFFL